MKISVLGCGRWGGFIAWYLRHIGNDVTIYGLEEDPGYQSLKSTRTNGILTYDDDVKFTSSLKEALEGSDLVLTGEGCLDGQSAFGKAPVGVAREAKKHGIPTVAIGGCVTEEADALHDLGIDAFFPIPDAPCTLAEAMTSERAIRNIERTVREAVRLYLAAKGKRP